MRGMEEKKRRHKTEAAKKTTNQGPQGEKGNHQCERAPRWSGKSWKVNAVNPGGVGHHQGGG